MESPEEAQLPPVMLRGLEDFLEALRVEAGLSRNTLSAYRSDIETFLRWADGKGLRTWKDVTPEEVVDFLDGERAQGRAESSVARRLSALRMCLRHLVQEGVLPSDPLVRIAAPVLRRSLPTTLTVEEVERLLAAASAASRRSPSGSAAWMVQRDTALLEVLYACGARISEAVGLRTDALEPSLRVLRLYGKGKKTRIVPLGARARAALELWLGDGRRRLDATGRSALVFLSKSGRPLDRTTAWRRVKALALQAGLPADISPHTLRHSFASHLIEGGADLRSVQEMLGHASIKTTEVYTHLDADHVRSIHRLYHPRG